MPGEGKTETDGCLIIPEQEDAYFVASYDPKLTYDVKGYDLNAEEKNKAAFYLLSEQNDDYIRENLKKSELIDGHIFVSDLFLEGQFDTVPDRVQEWFALVEVDDPGINLPVIFLPLEQLLANYDIFDSHYDQIEAYISVRRAFREGLIKQLRDTEQGRGIIDDDAVDQIEQAVIRARDAQPRSRQVQEYSDT